MKASKFVTLFGGLFLIGASVGCVDGRQTNRDLQDAAAFATVPGPGMVKTSDLVFKYRQQADELRELARQLETESAFYAERNEAEEAARKQKLALEARAAADAADQQAHQYRRQIPHGQVY